MDHPLDTPAFYDWLDSATQAAYESGRFPRMGMVPGDVLNDLIEVVTDPLGAACNAILSTHTSFENGRESNPARQYMFHPHDGAMPVPGDGEMSRDGDVLVYDSRMLRTDTEPASVSGSMCDGVLTVRVADTRRYRRRYAKVVDALWAVSVPTCEAQYPIIGAARRAVGNDVIVPESINSFDLIEFALQRIETYLGDRYEMMTHDQALALSTARNSGGADLRAHAMSVVLRDLMAQ